MLVAWKLFFGAAGEPEGLKKIPFWVHRYIPTWVSSQCDYIPAAYEPLPWLHQDLFHTACLRLSNRRITASMSVLASGGTGSTHHSFPISTWYQEPAEIFPYIFILSAGAWISPCYCPRSSFHYYRLCTENLY